jgi:succinate dehydrogenase / fumarate reductase membrane anchor subunit
MVIARAHGLKPWLAQRFSAVYMTAYLLFFLIRLSIQPPHGFSEWRGFMTSPLTSTSTLLLFAFLLIHAWVGMRDIAMDYLHSFKVRLTVLSLIAAGLIAMGAWLLLVLARAI